MEVPIIRLDCNIISSAFVNGVEAYTLFVFDVDVEYEYNFRRNQKMLFICRIDLK